MAADHCLQLSRTDLSECLWPLFGAAGFQPTTWGTQGLAPVSAGQLTIEPPYHRFARLPFFFWEFWRCWTVETGLSDDAWWSRKNVERPLNHKEPRYDGIHTLSFRTLHVGVIYLLGSFTYWGACPSSSANPPQQNTTQSTTKPKHQQNTNQ